MLATRLLLIGSATVAVAGLIAVAVGQWELRLEASDVLPSPPNV